MRTLMRSVTCAFLLAALAGLAACQRASNAPAEAPAPPSNAEREAEIAAEQLAALGGPASPQQRALYEGDFQASGGIDALSSEGGGAEGAWELRLLSDYAQLSRPGLGDDGAIPGEREYHERGMRVIAGPLTITIMQQACTASGVELPYVANVLFEGVSYQGCARRGVQEGARPTWAAALPDLMPAIDACLERVTARPARVTFATMIGEGQSSVRIRDADGARRECIVGSAGEIAVFEPISDLDRRASEGDPEFQRAGAAPRASDCVAVEPALGRDGEQLGWLIRRSC
jgi:uncharacterized membrane protein